MKILTAFLAAALFVASPAFCADEPGSNPWLTPNPFVQFYSMIAMLQSTAQENRLANREIKANQLAAAAEALQRSADAARNSRDPKYVEQALMELQTGLASAAIASVPAAAALRTKAVGELQGRLTVERSAQSLDQLKAERTSLEKTLAATEGQPEASQKALYEQESARAEADRVKAQNLLRVISAQKDAAAQRLADPAQQLIKSFQQDSQKAQAMGLKIKG